MRSLGLAGECGALCMQGKMQGALQGVCEAGRPLPPVPPPAVPPVPPSPPTIPLHPLHVCVFHMWGGRATRALGRRRGN